MFTHHIWVHIKFDGCLISHYLTLTLILDERLAGYTAGIQQM